MSLASGHRLGAYEVLALIGAGGMGDQDRKVYTLTVKGTDAKGQAVNSVMVYEKR